jgi:uncharacterized membrane protein
LNAARGIAAACTVVLLALQWAWRAAQPAQAWPWWLPAALFSLPLLFPVLAFLLRRPRAPLWAGTVALLYFCHGIAEWRAEAAQATPWALAETLLAVVLVFAAGWPGIAAKLAKRREAPPPNV